MPDLEVQDLNQHAVLWAYAGMDAHGQPTVSAATEIHCRWEYVSRASQNPGGGTQPYDAVVFVDQDLTVESVMWLGRQRDLPSPTTNLYRVSSFDKVPDVKGRVFERMATLNKRGDTLPTVE